MLTDERAATAIVLLRRTVAYYRRRGIRVEAVLTDNGSAYVSAIHALRCRRLGIRHLRTRPRRPQTNGKAERFIRTMLNGWAYGAIYRSSRERTAALDGWALALQPSTTTLSPRPSTTREQNQPPWVIQLGVFQRE